MGMKKENMNELIGFCVSDRISWSELGVLKEGNLEAVLA